MTPGDIGDFGAACDLFARVVQLYALVEGMKAENQSRERSGLAVAYPESAFDQAIRDCGFG